MAATGIFSDAIDAVTDVLTALNVPWATDPRNARPGSVLVELPSFDTWTYNVGDIRVAVRILAAPPSNQDAGNYLISMADKLMNSELAITGGRPGYLTLSGQDLPTYDLTVAVAVRRN